MDTLTPSEFPQRFDRFLYNRLAARERLILGIVAALGLLALVWFVAKRSSEVPKVPGAPVHVAVAKIGDTNVVEHTVGTVLAQSTVNVTAQVSGQLMAAPFKEGQLVHKGDLLFVIDPRPFQDALAQAQAALARDQANQVNAETDARRFVTLFAENAASQSQRDQAVATAKADAAIVKADEAAVGVAKLNLEYTQIRSPIDGKTGPILIHPGNLVTAGGANPLVTITQIQPVKVSFSLPQSDLQQIQNQMSLGQLQALVPMPGAPNGHETARVDFVGNTVSDTTGTIELRATFDNADLRLVPGQLVDVGAQLRSLKHVVIVPRNAVNPGPKGTFLYVVDAQSTAQMRPVTVLNDDGTNDAVQGKVRAGDKVVTEGQLRLVPGSAVEITQGGMLASPAETAPGAQ